jgi:RNA polymerase sigma-70 factor (ECF subfamily)
MTAIEFNNQIIGYENNLRQFAISLTSNRDDAYDLVQETFVKAFSYRDRLTDYSNLKSWVFSIMKNTFINNYRKASRQFTTNDEDVHSHIITGRSDDGKLGPDSIYSECEILAAIEGLEPEYKEPFKMHLKGYKYQEIADELGLHMGTVKSRIFNARRILMEILKDLSN